MTHTTDQYAYEVSIKWKHFELSSIRNSPPCLWLDERAVPFAWSTKINYPDIWFGFKEDADVSEILLFKLAWGGD